MIFPAGPGWLVAEFQLRAGNIEAIYSHVIAWELPDENAIPWPITDTGLESKVWLLVRPGGAYVDQQSRRTYSKLDDALVWAKTQLPSPATNQPRKLRR